MPEPPPGLPCLLASNVTITCDSPPPCTGAGTTVQLDGACEADEDGVAVTYLVNGSAVTEAACPEAGGALPVWVQAGLPLQPNCTYNATFGFDLTGAPRRLVSFEVQRLVPRRPVAARA